MRNKLAVSKEEFQLSTYSDISISSWKKAFESHICLVVKILYFFSSFLPPLLSSSIFYSFLPFHHLLPLFSFTFSSFSSAFFTLFSSFLYLCLYCYLYISISNFKYISLLLFLILSFFHSLNTKKFKKGVAWLDHIVY